MQSSLYPPQVLVQLHRIQIRHVGDVIEHNLNLRVQVGPVRHKLLGYQREQFLAVRAFLMEHRMDEFAQKIADDVETCHFNFYYRRMLVNI